jgi:predicted DNA-binding transcriptional regulator AlpA
MIATQEDVMAELDALMDAEFNSVRVVDEPTAIKLVGVSPRTWDRMRSRGETPPVTQLSARRIGYRVVDLKKWLDARRHD